MDIEDGLRRIEAKAALLRYMLDLASGSDEHPDSLALSGAGDVAGDLVDLAQELKRALGLGIPD